MQPEKCHRRVTPEACPGEVRGRRVTDRRLVAHDKRSIRRTGMIARSGVLAVVASIVCAMGVLATAGEAAASGSISSPAASERLVHTTLHASAFRDGAELRSHYAGFESGSHAPSLPHQQFDAVAFGSFGSALVASAPVGNGPDFAAVDPATHTLYVTNGFNDNGPTNAGGNTVSVIDERHCQADDVSRCKGPWPTLTVGSDPNADPSGSRSTSGRTRST